MYPATRLTTARTSSSRPENGGGNQALVGRITGAVSGASPN
jgi:hypothetical protein